MANSSTINRTISVLLGIVQDLQNEQQEAPLHQTALKTSRLAQACSQSSDTTNQGLAAVASRLLREYDDRQLLFPAGLFADPAWNILLDLYVHQAKNRMVSVTSACIASRVPPTTGLRWIGRLEECGLIDRFADPKDARKVCLRLTRTATEALTTYLVSALGDDTVQAIQPSLHRQQHG